MRKDLAISLKNLSICKFRPFFSFHHSTLNRSSILKKFKAVNALIRKGRPSAANPSPLLLCLYFENPQKISVVVLMMKWKLLPTFTNEIIHILLFWQNTKVMPVFLFLVDSICLEVTTFSLRVV